MRAPIRSESDAFWFVLAGAALLAVALVIGWLTQPRIGAAVFVVTAAALIVAYMRVASRDRRAVLRAAAGEPHPHGAAPGKRHVLVIANEPLSGAELRERILARDGERVEIDVLAPVLTSRVHLSVSDIDRKLAEAHERLERSLGWARAQGIVAGGEVGEPSPIMAIEDELRDFGADEVIVVTHPRERETWQEHGELKRLRREPDVPVTHVVVEDGGAAQQTTL